MNQGLVLLAAWSLLAALLGLLARQLLRARD
jgi:hypothetical protein